MKKRFTVADATMPELEAKIAKEFGIGCIWTRYDGRWCIVHAPRTPRKFWEDFDPRFSAEESFGKQDDGNELFYDDGAFITIVRGVLVGTRFTDSGTPVSAILKWQPMVDAAEVVLSAYEEMRHMAKLTASPTLVPGDALLN